MSAVNATPFGTPGFDAQNGKTAEQKAHEPSMEEILASIRRIIADDQAPLLSSRAAPGLRGEATPGPFELRTTQFQPLGRTSVRVVSEIAPREAPSERAEALPAAGPEDLSPEAHSAGEEAVEYAPADELPPTEVGTTVPAEPPYQAQAGEFDHRAAQRPQAMLQATRDEFDPLCSAETSASVASSFNALSASMLVQNLPSVEELARDMLRPMLKAWLDDNLPTIVERLVRAEIERVARGGR